MSELETMLLFEDVEGPIERLWWANFVVNGETHGYSGEGRAGKGKDIRVIGKEVTRWKEREGHRLDKSMITGVYDDDIEVLIIGTGVEGAINVPTKVRAAVEKNGIREVIVEPTAEACRDYNRLYRAGKRVALLAHGTC